MRSFKKNKTTKWKKQQQQSNPPLPSTPTSHPTALPPFLLHHHHLHLSLEKQNLKNPTHRKKTTPSNAGTVSRDRAYRQ
jgi:hypothetical protein